MRENEMKLELRWLNGSYWKWFVVDGEGVIRWSSCAP